MMYSTPAKLGVKLSRLGFGCMRLPILESGKIDRKLAAEMVDKAYKSGVNYFDTAYGYHDGESELFLGETMPRYPRESFYLADKLPTWLLQTEADPERLFNEQLGKLGVDYIDFYLLHSLDKDRWPAVKATKAYELLQEKKKEGKIRFLGFSYHGDFDTFCEIIDQREWDFVQIQINYLDYTMSDAKAYHDKLSAKGIPCVVMEPVRGGFLAGLPDSARAVQKAVNGDSAAAWALRWCMDMENMPVILSGMSTMAQVEENLDIFSRERPLSGAERKAIEETKEAILAVKTIPCTACRYCMDCDYGVNIPGMFTAFNRLKLFKNEFRAKIEYAELGSDHDSSNCVKCGVCVSKCPQGIDIPARMEEVEATFKGLQ